MEKTSKKIVVTLVMSLDPQIELVHVTNEKEGDSGETSREDVGNLESSKEGLGRAEENMNEGLP